MADYNASHSQACVAVQAALFPPPFIFLKNDAVHLGKDWCLSTHQWNGEESKERNIIEEDVLFSRQLTM
jgi:hypothetical protein